MNNKEQGSKAFSKEAADVLKKIEKAAKNNRYSTSKSIPSIFLVGDIGVGRTEFACNYEKLLASNKVYTVRGTGTYVELVFPANGSERDYQRFFRSPGLVASIQNKFYGVFAISFEEWKGKELIESEVFNYLLTFIDNNRDNIYFVFMVTSDFLAREELRKILNNHINLAEVFIEKPSMSRATDFIISSLNSDGISFDQSGKKALSTLLSNKLDMDSSSFSGYRSLTQISKSILFELSSEDVMGKEGLEVTEYMLHRIEDRISTPESVDEKANAIGFLV